MTQFETNQIQQDDFIRVSELGFKDSHGKPFFIQGINYWSCMNLAAEAEMGGNLTRFQIELDRLEEVGVNVIRIMAATEGATTHQPFRVYPVMQPSPGQWDERKFVALDRCIAEAGKRNIRVLMVMGNTWQWTGGIAQYVSWANDNVQIPYPRSWDMKASPQRDDGYAGWGNWTNAKVPPLDGDDFMSFQARFYEDEKAQELYVNHLLKVLNRTNSITGREYIQDPTILAWEPLNEPQTADAASKKIGKSEDDPMIVWHHKISSLIKAKAPNQLSTTGSEAKQSEALFKSLHTHHSIDFCCAHIWAEIWGYYDMLDGTKKTLEKAKGFASQYLDKVRSWSNDISKPIILEEFGMARDNWKNQDSPYIYSTKTATTHRDAYFSHLFEIVLSSFEERTGFAGLMPWSYGGMFDTEVQQYNSFDMVLAGDPPQEPPGWFSVLHNDSTMDLMSKWHDRIALLFV